MNKKPYFSVKAIIYREGKFLVLHKEIDAENKFEFPGGRIEYGESAEETVVREVFEETGLSIRPVKLIDTWNLVKEEFHATGVFFLCIIESGEFKLSEEHDKYQWLDFNKNSIHDIHEYFQNRMIKWNWTALENEVKGE